ncbi:MAG: hypothetical protein LM601_07290 [Candidatus Verstraetearchaeota archaeon]|nr:hypothetical protein [Candidatus Verstraetearchaeota archaeon]
MAINLYGNTVAIVTTTINIPYFLESYIQNFESYSVDNNGLVFIIIGDLRSPHQEIKEYIQRITSNFAIEYWDVKSQRKWISETFGSKAEKIEAAIPYNSIRRRNLGYLRALELGSDVIVTIDDDNYPGNSNWLLEHLSALNTTETLPTISSKSNMVNPCHILKFNRSDLRVYSRGYPFSKLFCDTFDVEFRSGGRVALNMGLWTKSPDVDAYTNILHPDLESLGIKEGFQRRYALAPNNYMPVNTQNTSFIRELAPAFYDVLMDTNIHGVRLDRYDDIWAGLFALKLIHKLGYRATFGVPLTEHRRNKHDYVSDLKSELIGMSLNDLVHEIVMKADVQAKSFADGYLELADVLMNEVKRFVNDEEVLSYFSKLTEAMRIWVDLVGVFE